MEAMLTLDAAERSLEEATLRVTGIEHVVDRLHLRHRMIEFKHAGRGGMRMGIHQPGQDLRRGVGVHQQTLRNYERWGLVVPRRSKGGTRYYSSRDIERIEKIREWIDVLGINRAGVEVMTRLLRRITELETS